MLENYKPGEVNKQDVASYFHAAPESLFQPYRNIVGIVERGERKCFLKLATEEGAISEHNRNEVEIYRRRESGNYPLPVKTPKVVETGIYQQNGKILPWFITEYLDSQEVLPYKNADTSLFSQHLPIIIDTAIAIMDWQQEPSMPIDIPKNEVAQSVIEKVNGWVTARLTIPENTQKAAKAFELKEKFFSDGEKLKTELDTCPSHGDFVPNNFRITTTGELYLMDMEHTRMNKLKFYDAAYMYHRLYTKYKKPDLAQEFLQLFIDRYSQTHMFDERALQNFRLTLAERLIGGYFDAVADGVTDWSLQDELTEKLLAAENTLDPLLGKDL